MLRKTVSLFAILLASTLTLGIATSQPATAATKSEINAGVQETLALFRSTVEASESLLAVAKGVLVFPSIGKAAFIVGAEYGEGAMMIDDVAAKYYSTSSASFGFQAGVQQKSIVIVFTEQDALDKFLHSKGWTAGVDGTIVLGQAGGGEQRDLATPILGYVLGQKGLMLDVSLAGSKYSIINPEP